MKCPCSLKPCCNYVFKVSLLSLSKKEKNEYDYYTGFFAFTKNIITIIISNNNPIQEEKGGGKRRGAKKKKKPPTSFSPINSTNIDSKEPE